ncbi:MAG: PilT protein [uncultured bacterium]|nr:MAG: PilT protein [uncultured bacterium]HCS39934.1 VapC toxin family PIN domain ribonuclease [Anaerolineaceae bacterium]
MNDKYFIDTNILIYSIDNQDKVKKPRSLALVNEAIISRNGIISWQVLQEFLNVATRKFETTFKPHDLSEYTQKVLNPLCEIYPDINLYHDALGINQSTNYSFYDSLILASAIRAECTILYSEDFQAGQIINRLKVVNPFLD